MATARRLTRKAIRQPDWFQRATQSAIAAYRDHRALTLLGVGVFVAVLLAIWGFQAFKERQDAMAAQDFAEAINLYQTGKYNEAVAAFQKVETHRWSRYANLAHLYEANGYLELRDFQKAISAAQRFIAGTKDRSLMRQIGLFTLGNIEERSDRCKEAVQHYGEAERITAAFREMALLGKARCLEKIGDLQSAIAGYKEYLKTQPNPQVALQVTQLELKLTTPAGKK